MKFKVYETFNISTSVDKDAKYCELDDVFSYGGWC